MQLNLRKAHGSTFAFNMDIIQDLHPEYLTLVERK
jgi:hypothetical protein